MKRDLVKNWMTREVIAVSLDTTLWEADRIMTENRIRRLPVVEHGRLAGIVTQGDLRGAKPGDSDTLDLWDLSCRLDQLRVEEIMTPDPVAITEDATVDEAAWEMWQGKISGLPVVNDDLELMGIITESDIFRLVVREWGTSEERYVESVKGKQDPIR